LPIRNRRLCRRASASNRVLGLTLAVALGAYLVSPGRSMAGGLILYEVGTEDVGLASAGYSARAQDASTVLTNPAGMARLSKTQLLIGTQALYGYSQFTRDVVATSPQLGADDGGIPIGWFPGGGAFLTHAMSPKVTLGFAATGNFGLAETYDDGWVGRYYIQSGTLLGVSLLPSVAYKASDKVSLGASLNAMYATTKNKVAVNNIGAAPDGELNLDDNQWGFGGNFGLMYEASAGTRLGITYNSQVNLDFSAPAEFSGLSSGLNAALGAAGLLNANIDIGMKVPQGVMASFYRQANDKWAVLGSAGWQQWSEFGRVEISIDDASNPKSLTTNLNFRDTWHGALGAQHHMGETWLMNFGIAYDSGFQNGADVSPAMAANWAWRFGAGGQHQVSEKFGWGFSAEWAYGGTLGVAEQSQVPVTAGGRGDLYGSYDNTGILFLSANFGWKF
jgi:long-chain fatty acid transport protein